MKILIVGLIKGSQITRFQEEAQKLGHQVTGCHSKDLIIETNGEVFNPTINGKSLSDFDLIYLCAGVESKMRLEWFVACQFLLKNTKTKIVNSVVANPNFNYYPIQSWFYLKQFENKIRSPKTYSIYSEENLELMLKNFKLPAIMKISEMHQGKGVFLINNFQEGKDIMIKNPMKTYLLREFIPNDGDVRIFTVGFKAVAAMKRKSAEGDFRNNISQGATGEIFDLEKNKEIKEIAQKAAKITGIEIAGVDIMIGIDGKPYLLEVNVGPQFKGLEKYTNKNIASEIIKYFVSL
ncbi:MAG TPA: ATP-grasp domain-containing protein [Patescibacteria group bacterium]|nr:ATP-grasp domain-containing protein [Patescibacteria group bacterium]